mmetsp:Transcript_22745/g.25900  ORF Transcript_22745/g.25900 Transcript_22745/m.25900 type:complete len:200 (-) Transcript_22745:232-831(-)|eukprot:CAMPEP_0194145458 /NCGR_PEP_ID=MMETSP0152-20130528/17442_1 /TAXON_ID=1049557 /ORGANISM="Thalassiothrix antarctica, Strain L6-D1" /LENGTH=199 /DNA_ID=CAMNT_0038845701 /DNA_START=81 /DNA_END=680 /DNA_ORIENTATION=+
MCDLLSKCARDKCRLGWDKGSIVVDSIEKYPHVPSDDETNSTASFNSDDDDTNDVDETRSVHCDQLIRRVCDSISVASAPTTKKEKKKIIELLSRDEPKWQYEITGDNDEQKVSSFCFICMEDFGPEDRIVSSKCSKSYHHHCMLEWVKGKHDKCPDCFASIWDHIEFDPLSCKLQVIQQQLWEEEPQLLSPVAENSSV